MGNHIDASADWYGLADDGSPENTQHELPYQAPLDVRRKRRQSNPNIDAIHEAPVFDGMAPAQLYCTESGRLFHSGKIALVTVGLPARGKTSVLRKLSGVGGALTRSFFTDMLQLRSRGIYDGRLLLLQKRNRSKFRIVAYKLMDRLGVKTRAFHLGDYRRAHLGEGNDIPPDYFHLNGMGAFDDDTEA